MELTAHIEKMQIHIEKQNSHCNIHFLNMKI